MRLSLSVLSIAVAISVSGLITLPSFLTTDRGSGRLTTELADRGSGRLDVDQSEQVDRGSGRGPVAYRGSGRITQDEAYRGSGRIVA
ncbi:hypothetical protein [Leptothoe kymatousa]|uniref:Uncharacterized protein n=1 Tax=Leptothoe kymatousa TAU-MAC 1615 TaxID=2364775 RepID=A0ABS5XYD3_9CYAN|nr:hypothetical protein [Leptothoe kymatousa]MBT9310661.1 hypothetical protein [Leptothoe kymatousa TAU-MAC 1615]